MEASCTDAAGDGEDASQDANTAPLRAAGLDMGNARSAPETLALG